MKSHLFLAACLFPLATQVQAQTPKLLKDINGVLLATPSNITSMPPQGYKWAELQSFSQLGKVILFSAYSPSSGTEIWRSDGTAAGTKLLKDINPGPGRSSSPRKLRVTHDGKRAFFTANDGSSGFELWGTDGTSQGTVLVKDIYTGSKSSSPDGLVPLGPSSVVFRASNKATGQQIFISDGSAKGTKLLADVRSGPFGSGASFFCATRDGKKVFFAADDGTNGIELWVTDGTSAGTSMVKDIRKGAGGSHPGYLRALGTSRVVFQSNDGNSGNELWISDGTSAGTTMIIDLNKGQASGASLRQAVSMGNKILFEGNTPGTGAEPFVTDGTAKGTHLLIDTMPGGRPGYVFAPIMDTSGKKAYWLSLNGAQGYRIYVTDGTAAGSKLFASRNIRRGFPPPTSLIESQGKIYFEASDVTPGTGLEICVTDGTAAGTRTLRDTFKGRHNGGAGILTRSKSGQIFYTANDGVAGTELWVTDGKRFQQFDINKPKITPTLSADPSGIVRFGKYVLFSASDGKSRTFMDTLTWISDGTTSGTTLLKDRQPSTSFRLTFTHAVVGDKVVFDLYTKARGSELYITDGTSTGTKPLMSNGLAIPSNLSTVGGKVYFWAHSFSEGKEPWVTDGSSAGTRMIKDLHPGTNVPIGSRFCGHGNVAVFAAGPSKKIGRELYITDGTTSGTKLLRDLNPGPGSSNPMDMVYSEGKVYFAASTPGAGSELWVTDFTAAGTRMVSDINPGVDSSTPQSLTARNGLIYFSASTPSTGRELFVSDGTAAGTRLFLDLVPGAQGSSPRHISAVGSRKVYFSTRATGGKGEETVVTDGTTAGTKVFDIYPGPRDGHSDSNRSALFRVAIGSQVFLRGNHPHYGQEVFTIDNGATAEPIGTPYGSTWIQGSDPVLNGVATITGGTGLANAAHVILFGAPAARPMRLGKAGFAHFDLRSYFGITAVTTGKRFGQSFAIPGDASLKGVQIVFQTLSFDTTRLADTLELSNGLHWAVGN